MTLTLTPLEDQHLGGAIMLLVGGVAYLLGGLWLTGLVLKGRVAASGEHA
jgi:putative membrane protein